MFLNQYEIQDMARRQYSCPKVLKGVELTLALMEAVNTQSDGWAYWNAPSHSCQKLFELLKLAGTRGAITEAQLKAAITPIRRMVTIQKKKQAKYGNKFEFDVDETLKGICLKHGLLEK